jgi:hypothetical protein
MEKHLFKFGGSLALVMPKRWTEKNALVAKSEVYLSETETGDILISGKVNAREVRETSVNSRTNASFLSKLVDAYHLHGAKKVRIHSTDHLTKEQVKAIVNKINLKCPGFEITSQSTDDIIIEDFTDIKEIDVHKIMLRIRSLIKHEFDELRADKSETIPETEVLIDRFYRLGVRYLYITQPKDALVYFRVLLLLETIGDQLYYLSSESKANKNTLKELSNQFDSSFSAFLAGTNVEIEEAEEMKDTFLKRLRSNKPKGDTFYVLKELSINMSKIANYGLKVAQADSLL